MTELENNRLMAKFEKGGHSFLIRLWEENRDKSLQPDELRGWVYHIQSDQKRFFQSTDEITRIINSYLDQNIALEQVFDSIQEDSQ